jgi:hypothetical protein
MSLNLPLLGPAFVYGFAQAVILKSLAGIRDGRLLRPGQIPFCAGLFSCEERSTVRTWIIPTGFGAFMHKADEGYRQRAIECLAFAEHARSQEERSQLLIMAKMLERLALGFG